MRTNADRTNNRKSKRGDKRKRTAKRPTTNRVSASQSILKEDPQPKKTEYATVENLLVEYVLPRTVWATMSDEQIRSDGRACWVEYAGSAFGETFKDFTIQQFGVSRGLTTNHSSLSEYVAAHILDGGFVFIVVNREPDQVTYELFQIWYQRIRNSSTEAYIELVRFANRAVDQTVRLAQRLFRHARPKVNGRLYPWSQQIVGIELAQYRAGSPKIVVNEITRLAQGLLVLPGLAQIGRPKAEAAEKRFTIEDALATYGRLSDRFGKNTDITRRLLCRELGVSDADFTRLGFKIREIRKEYEKRRRGAEEA